MKKAAQYLRVPPVCCMPVAGGVYVCAVYAGTVDAGAAVVAGAGAVVLVGAGAAVVAGAGAAVVTGAGAAVVTGAGAEDVVVPEEQPDIVEIMRIAIKVTPARGMRNFFMLASLQNSIF